MESLRLVGVMMVRYHPRTKANETLVSLPATFYVWLASPEGAFLKGKFLWANWDVDELKLRAKELESSTDLTIGLVGWPWGEAPFKFESKDESAGDQWK